MTRLRKNLKRLGASLAWIALAHGAGAAETTEWKYRQSLRVERPGVVSLALPDETLDAARADFGDLRVIDPGGREIAFLVHRTQRPAALPVRVTSFRSRLTATATELTIETGDSPVTAVILETPAVEFVKSARVETSNDGATWRVSETGLPLFRQRGAERLQLPAAGPFVRITIDDARSRPVPFTGAKGVRTVAADPGVRPVAARIARREEFPGETVLTLELAAAHVPLASLVISTPERLFNRRVFVGVRELRDESATERVVASGAIHREASAALASHAMLALDFTPPTREITVHIVNDDSPPLAVNGVQVSRYDVTVFFDAPVTGDYALLTGHPHIAAPRYDVSGVRVTGNTGATLVALGPLGANPGFRTPEALAGTALLGGALDPSSWSYRKPVQLAAPGVQQLELDLDVLAHAQRGLGDLRLVRDGAQIPYLIDRTALSRSLELPVVATPDARRPSVSRWQIKLPRAGLPMTRLTLSSATTLFQRQLRVFESITDDRGNTYERPLASADWNHTPHDTRALTIALNIPPVTAVLVVETDNGDNPVIALGNVTGAYPVTPLLFKSEAPPVLYYGNAQATAPRYDVALVAAELIAAEKNAATLGPEEKAKPDGWTKTALSGARSGILFWGALGIVVIALLAVVAKLLPKAPAT